ncbi:MAG: hypothetical protein RIS35_1, partial [Pseudomonadota bacterium]
MFKPAPSRTTPSRLVQVWERFGAEAVSNVEDPAARIATSFFATLAALALIGIVGGLPFWVNKIGATAALALLLVWALWGRKQSMRGRQVMAMHSFAALSTVLACLVATLSPRPAASALVLVTVLPSYAAVCGRRSAIGIAIVYLGVAAAATLARSAGIPLPEAFPLPPQAEIALSVLALLGIVGPLAEVYSRLVSRTRELAVHEERLRLAVAAARQGWFDLDLRDGSIEVSPEFASMLGIAPDAFRARDWFHDVHPEDLAAAREGHAAMLASDAPARYAMRRRGPGGDWICVDTLGRVVERDADGRAVRVIGVQTDVTAQRRAQAEVARYQSELETR